MGVQTPFGSPKCHSEAWAECQCSVSHRLHISVVGAAPRWHAAGHLCFATGSSRACCRRGGNPRGSGLTRGGAGYRGILYSRCHERLPCLDLDGQRDGGQGSTEVYTRLYTNNCSQQHWRADTRPNATALLPFPEGRCCNAPATWRADSSCFWLRNTVHSTPSVQGGVENEPAGKQQQPRLVGSDDAVESVTSGVSQPAI